MNTITLAKNENKKKFLKYFKVSKLNSPKRIADKLNVMIQETERYKKEISSKISSIDKIVYGLN